MEPLYVFELRRLATRVFILASLTVIARATALEGSGIVR